LAVTSYLSSCRELEEKKKQLLGAKEEKDKTWTFVGKTQTEWKEKEEAVANQQLVAALTLAKSLFKRDHPYRTTVGWAANMSTNSSGSIAQNLDVGTLLNNITELTTSLAALFDEMFVHSMTVKYFPYNGRGGAGVSTAQHAAGVVSTTSATTYVYDAGIVLAALFGPTFTFSSSTAMLANPNHKIVRTGSAWKYAWRNNVRFDPRGLNLASTQGNGWQGWTELSNCANYGGSVYIRALNDVVFGLGSSETVNLGSLAIMFDISLRARF